MCLCQIVSAELTKQIHEAKHKGKVSVVSGEERAESFAHLSALLSPLDPTRHVVGMLIHAHTHTHTHTFSTRTDTHARKTQEKDFRCARRRASFHLLILAYTIPNLTLVRLHHSVIRCSMLSSLSFSQRDSHGSRKRTMLSPLATLRR